MNQVSFRNLISYNGFNLGLAFMWNSIHPIILPAMLLHYVPSESKNTYLGLLTFVGLILAIIIQPLSGAWSDRFQSKWGRRRPFIFLGSLGILIFLAILGLVGGLVWLVIGYIGLQIVSNMAHGPLQGLLPDMVPEEQMGVAAGVKNLLEISALIVASLLAGRLLVESDSTPQGIFFIIMAVIVFSAMLTLFGSKEKPSLEPLAEEKESFFQQVSQIRFGEHKAFWWLMAGRLVFMLGVYGIQSFTQYYLADVLQIENAAEAAGNLLASIAVSLLVLSFAGGWITDKIGARKVLGIAGVLGMLGSFLLLFAKNMQMMLLFGSVLGAGIGLFLTANWALANRLVPSEKAGFYLGLTNLATAGAGAFGRLEGPLIDLLNNAVPDKYFGYTMMFLFGVIGSLMSLYFLSRVKDEKLMEARTK